jgi:menaquinone-dependent protoporphyrinogen IX oxidase
MKTLVAFFSRTGTNRKIAEAVARALGADLDEIIDLKKRSGAFGLLWAGKAARSHDTTEITSKLDPGEYDAVVLGSPIWAGNLTPALRTYLNKHDLKGKKVAFFFVCAINDPSCVAEELKTIVPCADIDSTLSLPTSEVKNEQFDEKVRKFVESLGISDTD